MGGKWFWKDNLVKGGRYRISWAISRLFTGQGLGVDARGSCSSHQTLGRGCGRGVIYRQFVYGLKMLIKKISPQNIELLSSLTNIQYGFPGWSLWCDLGWEVGWKVRENRRNSSGSKARPFQLLAEYCPIFEGQRRSVSNNVRGLEMVCTYAALHGHFEVCPRDGLFPFL